MQVTFEFHSAALLRILQGAKADGISPEAYLMKGLDKLQSAESTRPIAAVNADAIAEVNKLRKGASFLLDDVAPDYREVLNVPDRQQLGKQFRKSMESTGLAVFFERNGQNQAIYQRK